MYHIITFSRRRIITEFPPFIDLTTPARAVARRAFTFSGAPTTQRRRSKGARERSSVSSVVETFSPTDVPSDKVQDTQDIIYHYSILYIKRESRHRRRRARRPAGRRPRRVIIPRMNKEIIVELTCVRRYRSCRREPLRVPKRPPHRCPFARLRGSRTSCTSTFRVRVDFVSYISSQPFRP